MASVNVKHEPIRELIIKECIKFPSLEALARFAEISAGGRPTGLNWAEGVAFLYYPVPLVTETAIKELIEGGRVYWAFVGYALMPEYQRIVETRDKIILPVIDVSGSAFFCSVARWLREKST